MNGSKIFLSLFLTLSLILGGCTPRQKTAPTAAKSPAQMSPEEMQAAFERMSNINANHRALDPLVGKWKVISKMWMAPGAEPTTSTGSAEFRWILHGHYLEQIFHGTFMDKPFTGLGAIAYNNISGKYQSTWLDSMMTQIMFSEGTIDKLAQKITFTGKYSCGMTDADLTGTSILTIGSDRHVFEMFNFDEKGALRKDMEIVYVRDTTPEPTKKGKGKKGKRSKHK